MTSPNIEIDYDFSAGHATATAIPRATAVDLTEMPAREFYSHMAATNDAYTAARAQFRQAQEALTLMLTEQVARHVLNEHPTASLVFVRAAAEFHYDEAGDRDPNCEGHNERLVPFEVCDADGATLATFDPYSPVQYLMERLSPLLGIEDQILDIESRTWAYDCTVG